MWVMSYLFTQLDWDDGKWAVLLLKGKGLEVVVVVVVVFSRLLVSNFSCVFVWLCQSQSQFTF